MDKRRFTRRRMAGVAVLAVAAAAGLGAASAQAADSRLHMTEDALQKARALLEASESGLAPGKKQRQWERHVQRALHQIERARNEIAEAIFVVDNP